MRRTQVRTRLRAPLIIATSLAFLGLAGCHSGHGYGYGGGGYSSGGGSGGGGGYAGGSGGGSGHHGGPPPCEY